MLSMSIRGYAASRAANRKSIRRKIADGTIVLNGDGRIDSDQADRAWASTRQASRMGQHQNGEDGVRAATAEIAAAAARLRLAKQRFDSEQSRYVDRVDALRVGAYEAEYFLAALAAAPAVHAERFIEKLGVSPAVGRQILERFVEVVLTRDRRSARRGAACRRGALGGLSLSPPARAGPQGGPPTPGLAEIHQRAKKTGLHAA